MFCDPDEGRDNSGPSRRIQCAGCHIEAPFYPTESEAIAAWNRRTLSTITPAEAGGLVERLRGIYRIPITDGLGAVGSGEEPDNPNEFVRKFDTPPIQHEAATALKAQAAELAAKEEARAEQWRLRREAEGSRDAARAAIDTMRADLTAERAAHAETKRERAFWEDRENKAVIRAETAEAQRDEALKALGRLTSWLSGEYDDVPNAVSVSLTFDNGEEITAMPLGDFRAARRALTGGKDD